MFTLLASALAAPALTLDVGPALKAISAEAPVSETTSLGGRVSGWNSVVTPHLDGQHLRRASAMGTVAVRTPGRLHLRVDGGLGVSSVQQYGADCLEGREQALFLAWVGPAGVLANVDCRRSSLQGRRTVASTTASALVRYELDERWSLGGGVRTEGTMGDILVGLTWSP